MARCRIALLLTVILMMPGEGCGGSTARSTSRAQERLNLVALLLDSNSVGSVAIMHEPSRIEHPFQITLDALITSGGEEYLRIRGSVLQAHARDLAAALRTSEASESKWSGDVRWAVVVYDTAGKEVMQVGFSESGVDGYVNNSAVRMQNRLLKWARSLLPE